MSPDFIAGFDAGAQSMAENVPGRCLTVAEHLVLAIIWSANGVIWTFAALTLSGHLR